jgi:hypothetical protein
LALAPFGEDVMLKLVDLRLPASSDKRATRANQRNEARALYLQVDGDRSLGQATQRAVARARRVIVDAHCHVQRAEPKRAASPEPAVPPPDSTTAAPPDLTTRLADIHQRLLHFSGQVELEMDRLDILKSEIDAVVTRRRPSLLRPVR